MWTLHDATNEDVPGQHRIFYSVWDADYSRFRHTTNIELTPKHTDETETNMPFCHDMMKHGQIGMKDESGLGKWCIDPDGDYYEREGWAEMSYA